MGGRRSKAKAPGLGGNVQDSMCVSSNPIRLLPNPDIPPPTSRKSVNSRPAVVKDLLFLDQREATTGDTHDLGVSGS